jgi:hypothetical protein
MNIIPWLNANSSAITAIATLILVGITAWYVYLTRQMLKVANTPVIRMFLHDREHDIFLCVENIGTGFARDIKFTGDLSFKPFNPIGESEATLEELEPFKSGIEYLGPGHKVERFLFHRGDLKRVPNHTFDIIATYNDLGIAKEKKTFSFEIGNWDNTDQFGSPHADEVATAVKGVSGTLDRLRTHRSGQDKLNRVAQKAIKAPEIEHLERIANALEKLSSGK